jgi:hypothetical protein
MRPGEFLIIDGRCLVGASLYEIAQHTDEAEYEDDDGAESQYDRRKDVHKQSAILVEGPQTIFILGGTLGELCRIKLILL